ncbi:MAG: PqqD family protein [Ruminococcaceae bacterium]|nr:PqqD family protein [Oscillospiraceae bacterium]
MKYFNEVTGMSFRNNRVFFNCHKSLLAVTTIPPPQAVPLPLAREANWFGEIYMKLKDEIVLGSIDGKDFAIATGSLSKDFNGIINNNATANYIFQLLKTEQSEDSIVQAMLEKYDAPEEVIRADVKEVLNKLSELGILE